METSYTELLKEFESKCRKELGRRPKGYLLKAINNNTLRLNVTELKQDDTPQLFILFSLRFRNIHLLNQNLEPSQPRKHSNFTQQMSDYQIEQHEMILDLLSTMIADQNCKHLRSIKFQNISLTILNLQKLAIGIQKAKYLKQLAFVNCLFQDSHLQILRNSLAQNVSLNSLDFSNNNLKNIGQTLAYIFSKHGQRKKEILALQQRKNKVPSFDISNTGIFQINLESNELTSNTMDKLIQFLRHDVWIKSINLKNNNLEDEQVAKFVKLFQRNHTLINLDLRQNPGFNKSYSKLILIKLKQNRSKLKTTILNQEAKREINDKQNQLLQLQILKRARTNNKDQDQIKQKQDENLGQFRQFNKNLVKSERFQKISKQRIQTKILMNSPQRQRNNENYHSYRKLMNQASRNEQNQLSNFGRITKKRGTYKNKTLNNTFFASNDQIKRLHDSKKSIKTFEEQLVHLDCQKCCELQKKLLQSQRNYREMHIRALKAEKQSLQFQIELKKLRSFIEKNLDVSVIGYSGNRINLQNPPQLNSQNSNVSTSFNKILGSENDQEMISRIQVLVTQLTKIMETVQQFQNTEYTIEQPFQNVNSFSKTVSLYERPKQLMEIQQQISQDEALHLQQFGDGSLNLIQTSFRAQESILKNNKNQMNDQQY